MFQSFNGGLEGAIVKWLLNDWKYLCHLIRKAIHKGCDQDRARTQIKFGGNDVELCRMIYRSLIPISFLLSC